MDNSITLEKMVFNVSKETIEYITGKVNLYKTKTIAVSRCTGCSLLKKCSIGKVEIEDYCNSFCTKEDIKLQYVFTKKTKEFKYKKIQTAKFNTPLKSNKSINFMKSELSLNKYRFSELQIKQALLYYYLCNSKGIIKGVEKRKLAEVLNCTIKTIENNNKIFIEHNLFEIKRDCAGSVYVRINNYEKQYQKKKDNGQGYMPFVTSVFKKILDTTDLKVNEIRFLLRTLVKFDYNYKKKHKTKFMFNKIKTFLASNFHNLKSLKSLAEILNKVFKDLIKVSIVKNDCITVDLVDEVHGKAKKDKTLNENKALIRKLMYENNFMLKSKEYIKNYKTINELDTEEKLLTNLGELSIEYGYTLVKDQLLSIGDEIDSIDNFGGFIRDRIERFININRAYLKLI